MKTARTSGSDPLRVDRVTLADGCGFIGMTICPGKVGRSSFGYSWERNIDEDIKALVSQDAHGVLTIMEHDEMTACKVHDLGQRLQEAGCQWWYLDVRDGSVLPPHKYSEWDFLRRKLVNFVSAGSNLVIHCRGGLGRTGTFAAVLLMDMKGETAIEAINEVQAARRGTIENWLQRDFVLTYRRNFEPLTFRKCGEGVKQHVPRVFGEYERS